MKLALLTGLAALAGVTGAQAADFYAQAPGYVYSTPNYVADQTYVAPAPAYTYRPVGPAPFMPGYVIAEPVPVPAPAYVVTEPQTVVVAPPIATVVPRSARTVVTRPRVRTVVAPPTVITPDEPITTGYSTERSCFIDLIGIERCY